MTTPPGWDPVDPPVIGGAPPPAYEEARRAAEVDPRVAAAYEQAVNEELARDGSRVLSEGERNRRELEAARRATERAAGQPPLVRPVAQTVDGAGDGERNARTLEAARAATRARPPVAPSGPPLSEGERNARALEEARRAARARAREIERAPLAGPPRERSHWEREPRGTAGERQPQPQTAEARFREDMRQALAASLAETGRRAPQRPSPTDNAPRATSGPMGTADPYAFGTQPLSPVTAPPEVRNPLDERSRALLRMNSTVSQDVTRWGVSAQRARNPLGNAANEYLAEGNPTGVTRTGERTPVNQGPRHRDVRRAR